jgi:hypothetical protein
MPTNEPFPLELFPSSVREAILSEFKGRHPTNLQVARVSDARWLGCPRIGPTMLARMRSVARGISQRGCISPVASMTDIELLGQYELLQDELEGIQARFKESSTELWARGIVPPDRPYGSFRKPIDQAAHEEISQSTSGIPYR